MKKSDELLRTIKGVDEKIAQLKTELGQGSWFRNSQSQNDFAILTGYLEKKLGFSFDEVKAQHAKAILNKTGQITDLENKKKQLAKALEEASFEELLAAREIRFEGKNVVDWEGSRVHVHCDRCGSKSTVDVKTLQGFQELVHVVDENALKLVYRVGSNNLYVQCSECRKDLDVRAYRGKI